MKKIMKKTVLVLLILSSSLMAIDGESVYKSKCISCHQLKGMTDMSEMKMMRQKMQESGMKAPSMNMISMRLKMKTTSKKEFISFVKDYIQNPSQDKGYCMPMAYKRFGIMPPIGKGMSEKEREVIAHWLYDNFNESWKNSKDAKMCKNNN